MDGLGYHSSSRLIQKTGGGRSSMKRGLLEFLGEASTKRHRHTGKKLGLAVALATLAWGMFTQLYANALESQLAAGSHIGIAVLSGAAGAQTSAQAAQSSSQSPSTVGGQQAGESRASSAQQASAGQSPAQQPQSPVSASGATQIQDSAEDTFRPRLPMYYGKVVTEAQRQKIYEIQRKYFPQIRALQKQLEALIAKRDAEIEAVLTPQQKAEIERLRKEAAARRAAGSAVSQQEATSSTEK